MTALLHDAGRVSAVFMVFIDSIFRFFCCTACQKHEGGNGSYAYRRSADVYLWRISRYSSYILNILRSREAGSQIILFVWVFILHQIGIRLFGDTNLI